MKIETALVPVEGVKYEADEPASIMDFETDDCRFPNPVHVNLQINMFSRILCVSGTIETVVLATCHRCNTSFEHIVTSSKYSFEQEIKHPGEIIDLTQSIREDIILNLSQKSVCSAECKGLCPQCGQNLNEKDCGCEKVEPEGPFSALDDL
jgi:DUF177 domain-containing protein